MRAKIEYIHHSCYTVEIGDYFLVFDYFKGNLNIPSDKKVYFFASHSHADHFSKKIYDFKNVDKYILSYDIKIKPEGRDYLSLRYDQEANVDGMGIKTLKSTDEGVAFLIELMGKKIFFSGDLNDWYWEMEDSLMQKNDMHARFTREIDKLKQDEIDICFFLVDPRQQNSYDLGANYLLDNLRVKNFFPVHFWQRFDYTYKFKDEHEQKYRDVNIFTVEMENQCYEIEI